MKQIITLNYWHQGKKFKIPTNKQNTQLINPITINKKHKKSINQTPMHAHTPSSFNSNLEVEQ